jgi:GrpB-like predicted nucleotidyltransferase (UPF0157 family)
LNQDREFWQNEFADDGEPNRVRLMHHDARWRQEFEQTRSSVLQSCEGRVVTVEHIGSTAISGIIARPIIDIVAVVADPVDMDDSALLIQGLNFREVVFPRWAGNGAALKSALEKPRHGETTHRVFLVTQGSPLLTRATRFRDYLRATPPVALDFEAAKVQAWQRISGDQEAYQKAMAEIFDEYFPDEA